MLGIVWRGPVGHFTELICYSEFIQALKFFFPQEWILFFILHVNVNLIVIHHHKAKRNNTTDIAPWLALI